MTFSIRQFLFLYVSSALRRRPPLIKAKGMGSYMLLIIPCILARLGCYAVSVEGYRRFWTASLSRLQGSSSPRRKRHMVLLELQFLTEGVHEGCGFLGCVEA